MTVLTEQIDEAAASRGDAPYLEDAAGTAMLTYAGLQRSARAWARHLDGAGIPPGARVAVRLPDVFGYADLTLDVTARRLTRGDRVIELTRTEFGLLELLLRNAEQVISYDVIRERVWGYGEAPASNALQVFVGFLRRKLEDGGGPRLLHNVRGVGYVIRTAP